MIYLKNVEIFETRRALQMSAFLMKTVNVKNKCKTMKSIFAVFPDYFFQLVYILTKLL